MDFGVGFQSHIHNGWKHALLAEQMGFTNAWFVDSQMLTSDVYACRRVMTLAAIRIQKQSDSGPASPLSGRGFRLSLRTRRVPPSISLRPAG